MNIPRSEDSQEAVYEHFRRLLAQKETLAAANKHASDPIRRLWARVGAVGMRGAEVLERPGTMSLVVSLSVIFAGLSLVFLSNPDWRGDPLFNLARSVPPQTAMAVERAPRLVVERSPRPAIDIPQSPASLPLTQAVELPVQQVPETTNAVRDAVQRDAGESRSTAVLDSDPIEIETTAVVSQEPVLTVNEAFIVQVGSFRNPSNAMRVEESLRAQSADVTTDVIAGGLHSVRLGPFSERSAADAAAQLVQEGMGLDPLVVRINR
jgi:cell division septation protein DedD